MSERDSLNRRELLRRCLGLGAALGLSGLDLDVLLAEEAGDPWRGGTRLGVLPFAAEPRDPLETEIADGLDRRLYTDLSKVARDRLITPAEEFFMRTGVPDRLDPASPWRIRIDGLVKRPIGLSPADLEPRAAATGTHLVECAGNSRATRFGLISNAEWSGVPLSRLLAEAGPLPQAAAVRISGFDDHSRASTNSEAGCSWIFPLRQLVSAGAFLATRMNGRPLTLRHGAPVRLVVPGWYACCCIKWLNRIELVDGDQPATSQMREFAARTHQDGVPRRAADYRPATIDRAALPVRIEKWRAGGRILYRVAGIDWGGDGKASRLMIRFSPQDSYQPVDSQAHRGGSSWGVWVHPWKPVVPGRYLIQLKVDDPKVSARRLDAGLYLRGVVVDEV